MALGQKGGGGWGVSIDSLLPRRSMTHQLGGISHLKREAKKPSVAVVFYAIQAAYHFLLPLVLERRVSLLL